MPRLRILLCMLLAQCVALSADYETLGRLELKIPAGWSVAQRATSGEVDLLIFENGQDSIAFFKRPLENTSIQTYFASTASVRTAPVSTKLGRLTWTRAATSRQLQSGAFYVSHFFLNNKGTVYHGFSRSKTESSATANADSFLQDAILVSTLNVLSLTEASYTGKKYYLGWGAADYQDPSNMQNEVKYDVLHTQNVFAAQAGGNYLPDQYIGPSKATASAIRSAWSGLQSKMRPEDMFLQYSSGHGMTTGLGIGLSYKEIRDNALSLPARETVIIMMACYSGNLVDSFNAAKSRWQDYPQQGRSLLVLASTRNDEESKLGPGTDPDEPGPYGSAGSAFGYSVWKAISGKSDGYIDGVQDGFISFDELVSYSTNLTKQWGHTPTTTGAYKPHVLLNRIPSAEMLATMTGGTDGLSDAQIKAAIERLEADYAIHSEAL
ncbi:hypothetical protein K2X33_11580 [bacterium]|nr:hypothetical protein [bacterium]